ncbi:hypothetical protein HPB50_018023 [Hyalomma asiaticum]|uniref:Uncharacterized protein n=1 Tax=Hyalomma asiaticum TaxID=266040 RepID=A0ACB7S7L8_HYAAI|nr:hypothetical protein HPB50_018023 [Hyalomma asiaticum]
MPGSTGRAAADKSQKDAGTSSKTKRDQGKQGSPSQETSKDDHTKVDLSLSSTIKEDIDFKKRALLVSVNLVIMLISVIVLWHALYSFMFRPAQPYTFWKSLLTKSFVFTLLLHLDVFLIVFSGFLSLGSGVGFVGALRENVLFLQAYEVFIASFAVALIALTGLVFAFPQAARRSVMEKASYVDFVRAYRNNPDFQHLIDAAQVSLRCCGFSKDSFRDWNDNEYYRCDTGNPSVQRCSVPPSCCRPANSSKEIAVNNNLMCAKGVLLMDDQSAWHVVYTRSCADATHAYFVNRYRNYATAALLMMTVCLALIVVTRDVQDEIMDLRSIYEKYYQTVRHGQKAMRKAGVIEVVKPDDVAANVSTVGDSKPVVPTGKMAAL